MNNSLKIVIDKLEILFDKFNRKYFENELAKPIITVSPDTTSGAYGWCTTWKAWKDKKDDESDDKVIDISTITKEDVNKSKEEPGYYEINMCAEHLSRPFTDICGTLIHEMVHLLNLQRKIKDTSRSGKYHNKKFKQTAEEHGLEVSKDDKYGWCKTKLSPETKQWIIDSCSDEDCFSIYRSSIPKLQSASRQSTRKYVCPICGNIIRATKEVNVICGDCNMYFEEAES